MTGPIDISHINIDDYDYPLPDHRIAKFPKENRDESKLLIHQGQSISEDHFYNLAQYLPADSLLVVNNTKVVRARLFFRKSTGALIEIFYLEPVHPTPEVQMAFQQKGEATWQCLVGNARRWKNGILETEVEAGGETTLLRAEKLEQTSGGFLVKLSWDPRLTFAELLEAAGKIPLPPYLHREAIDRDTETYQTVYARYDGSVAAPTAGLHFTDRVFASLAEKNIETANLTLHVGAGTFKPVGQEGIEHHEMHTEQVLVSRELLSRLLKNHDKTIAVGTTSVRTLESLYWFGVQLSKNSEAHFHIRQYDPYDDGNPELTTEEAVGNILGYMDRHHLETLPGTTQLMIVPGYRFRIISGMVTNFHQPRSTLLLLISAWLGDRWKNVYDYALQHDFRFLSYGDSCLFL